MEGYRRTPPAAMSTRVVLLKRLSVDRCESRVWSLQTTVGDRLLLARSGGLAGADVSATGAQPGRGMPGLAAGLGERLVSHGKQIAISLYLLDTCPFRWLLVMFFGHWLSRTERSLCLDERSLSTSVLVVSISSTVKLCASSRRSTKKFTF